MADGTVKTDTTTVVADAGKTGTDTTKTDAAKTVDTSTDAGKGGDKTVKTDAGKTDGGKTVVADKPTGTILDGDLGADGKPLVAPIPVANFPENWREQLAGENKQLLTYLKRFSSPKTLGEGAFAMRQKVAGGELKSVLPDKATPEEVKAWRAENGVPETAEGYLKDLPNGVVVGKDDKPMLELFVKDMHDANVPAQGVQAAIAGYYKLHEKIVADQVDADKRTWGESQDALRSEWGPEFRGKANRITGYIEKLPDGLGELLVNARLADGSKFLGNAKALRWLDSTLNEIDPQGTVIGPTAGSAGTGPSEELAGIRKLMQNTKSEYYVGAGADKMQARYRQLLDWEVTQKKRTAA